MIGSIPAILQIFVNLTCFPTEIRGSRSLPFGDTEARKCSFGGGNAINLSNAEDGIVLGNLRNLVIQIF